MAFSQINIRGSYSITSVCKDGIIMAADSRGSLYFDEDNIIAYFDTVQKIFIIKDCIISVTGTMAISNKFISFYLNEFSQYLPNTTYLPSDLLNEFHKYYCTLYPSLKPDFYKIHLTAARYSNKLPLISVLEQGSIYSDLYSVASDTLSEFNNYSSSDLLSKSDDEMGVLMKQCISNYTNKFNKHRKIGGPIMILKVAPDNSITWRENMPTKENWDSVDEVYSDYLKGKVKFIFTKPETESEFRNWLLNSRK